MKLSPAEWQLMNALWEDYPATAREVAERLPSQTTWAYTTIKTMLTRLVRKGAVEENKRGNVSFYRPRVTKHKARKNALQSLAQEAFGGALGPLVHFVVEQERLSPTERDKLAKLLEKEKGKGDRQ